MITITIPISWLNFNMKHVQIFSIFLSIVKEGDHRTVRFENHWNHTVLYGPLIPDKECDTKMRVLYIYSLILKRQRGLMKISISQLTEYLPALWEHAEEHHLLRGAIVCLLLELTLSITSESSSLYDLLIPIINTSCNPHSVFYLYLADDGLDLWVLVFTIT